MMIYGIMENSRERCRRCQDEEEAVSVVTLASLIGFNIYIYHGVNDFCCIAMGFNGLRVNSFSCGQCVQPYLT